jgi:hypothetical protein
LLPNLYKSSKLITSARINPLSKSECIIPAACEARKPFFIVQALTSFFPAVRNVARSSKSYPAFTKRLSPCSSNPRSFKKFSLSLSKNFESSSYIFMHIDIAHEFSFCAFSFTIFV